METRFDDDLVKEMLEVVNHRETWAAVTAERAFVQTTGGGCRVPVAAYVVVEAGALRIRTMACLPDGSTNLQKVRHRDRLTTHSLRAAPPRTH